jgi:hypothetical protein
MPNEGEFEEFEPEESHASFRKKKREQRSNSPLRISLAPTTELEIVHTENGPKIKTVEYASGTQKDVEERISQQIDRISSLPNSKRTSAEKKWIEKKVS